MSDERPELVSIVMPPDIFDEFKPALERRFPGLELFRMPPQAESSGEHVYGITVRGGVSRGSA